MRRFVEQQALGSGPADRVWGAVPAQAAGPSARREDVGEHSRAQAIQITCRDSIVVVVDAGRARRAGARRGGQRRRHLRAGRERHVEPRAHAQRERRTSRACASPRRLRARRQLQRQPAPGLHPRHAVAHGLRAAERDARRVPRSARARASAACRRARTCASTARSFIVTVPKHRALGAHHDPARRRALHELLRADLRYQPRPAPAAAAAETAGTRAAGRHRRHRHARSKARACGSGTSASPTAAASPRSSRRPTRRASARCSSRAPTARATSGASSRRSWSPNCTRTA